MYLSGLVRHHHHPQNGIKNNDQDQNEPAASCHISKLVNDMCPVFHQDIYSKPIYLFMEKNQTLTAKTFEFWPASWDHTPGRGANFFCRNESVINTPTANCLKMCQKIQI